MLLRVVIMKQLINRHVKNLKPYEPGKPIEELQRELGIKDVVKLASNENPIGPSPKAVKAATAAVLESNRYPDGACFYLKKKLASKFRISPKGIIIGGGSDDLIDIITKAFLEENDEVMISQPAFLEYFILSSARGAKVKKIAIKNFKYDIKAMLSAITSRTKIVFIGNPDNPTGAYFTKDMLDVFMRQCPKSALVVFDEAYRELVDAKDYSDPFKYIGKRNVVVLRTFSKAYGLAGLRIGYGFSNENLISAMDKVRLPFNVSLPAQRAALAALDDTAHLKETINVIKTGKYFLVKNLKVLGLKTVISPANFILVNCGKNKGAETFRKLLKKGVIVRSMDSYGLPDYFRVNVGTMKENRRFIEALKTV